MIDFKGANVTLMISDMDKAIGFYNEVLGLKLKSRYGNNWAELEGPGITIALHPKNKGVKTGNNMQIGLSVGDIQSVVKELESKGVQFELNQDTKVKLASFTDPDGNILYLAQAEW